MKKLITTAFALFSATLMLSAQQTGKHHGKHKHRKQMAEQLNLSAEQKEQAKTYKKEFKEKMAQLEKNDQVTLKEYRLKRDALQREQKAKMKGLLTPEQQNKMAEMRKNKMEQRNAKRQQKMDRMASKLNLSSEQLNQVTARREATKKQVQALKDNNSYTREQKMEMIKELKKKNKEAFMAGLTEEQKKQIEEFKKNRKHKKQMTK